jgi:UDP-galactopyranose mutase
MYDYLVVGAGLYGSVFAHEMKKAGKSVLVIDRRTHIGGNCYTQEVAGIQQHVYGPHIFTTNNKHIWDYVNQFAHFEQYIHRVKANYKDKIYSFPINLMTLYQLWGCTTPEAAAVLLKEKQVPCDNPANLKDWLLAEVGEEIFHTFYEGYSSKVWRMDCDQIPCSVGKRVPIRLTYDDRYHDKRYSGIPKNGDYTQIFHGLLEGIEVKLGEDFIDLKWQQIAKHLVYSGAIDELFDYCYGALDYRSLEFQSTIMETDNFQGVAQMNYTDEQVLYTRIIEHKWFSPKNTKQSIITKEFPVEWEIGRERYYPVINQHTQAIYNQYRKKAQSENVIVGGRLGTFKYLDMDEVVAVALRDVAVLDHTRSSATEALNLSNNGIPT